MRKLLQKIGSDERHHFTGTFDRLGTKSSYGYIKQTLLLLDVRDYNGTLVTDHLWFNYTKGFEKANLNKGDLVEFDARVSYYEKGYIGDDFYLMMKHPIEEDYRLSYPTKIKKVEKATYAVHTQLGEKKSQLMN